MKLLILLILTGALINGCTSSFLGRCNSVFDCGKNQYCEAGAFKCKDVINECETDDDCTGYETCEVKGIATGWACKEGEECPNVYHNICIVTEETKKYCEQEFDCTWAFYPNSCCSCPKIHNKEFVNSDNRLVIYEDGKDYSSLRTIDCSETICSPCLGISDSECKNNQCEREIISS